MRDGNVGAILVIALMGLVNTRWMKTGMMSAEPINKPGECKPGQHRPGEHKVRPYELGGG